MKKFVSLAATFAILLGLVGCGTTATQPAATTAAADSAKATTAATAAAETQAQASTAKGASGKIAVIRLLTNSDHTAQFFAGCTAEGEALGYTVDTFMANGDDVKMQDLMEQAMQKDYDIWVVSHANEGYQNEILTRAVAKGIKVVGFDCGGEHVPGVTYTSQDDKSLAAISLDALIARAKANGATEPVTMIEINTLGAIVPFDTRHSVIDEYVKAGKLNVLQIVSPNLAGGGDFYSECNTAISTALSKYPKGQLGGVWSASSAFLDGVVDAIHEAGRSEVAISAVDISDTEVQRLVNVPEYACCAAVDPYVIGVVDVRLGVLKTLGVETPETYALAAVGVTGEKLTKDDTMKTLNKYFSNFGTTEDFNTPEIKALRDKIAK